MNIQEAINNGYLKCEKIKNEIACAEHDLENLKVIYKHYLEILETLCKQSGLSATIG